MFLPSAWPLPPGRDNTLRSAVSTRCPVVSPPRYLLPHLCHCHLPTKTRSAAGGLLSDTAAPPSTFISAAATHVFKPPPSIKHNPLPATVSLPPCSWTLLVSSPPPWARCWHRHTKTNTIFLSSSTRMRRSLRSHLVSLLLRVWGGEGLTAMGAWMDLGHG